MLLPSSVGFAFGVRERSLAAATVERGPPLERDRLAELAVGAYSDCRSRRGWAADDEVEVSASAVAATVEGRAPEDGARAVRAGVCSDDDDPPPPPMEGLRRAEVERAERSDEEEEEAPATFVNLSIEPKHFNALLNGTHVRGCADGRCRHTANPAKKASKWTSTSS